MADVGGVVFKDNLDARAAPNTTAPAADLLVMSERLHALGLGSAFDGAPETLLSSSARMQDVFGYADILLMIHAEEKKRSEKVFAELRAEIAALRLENARSTGALAEAKAKLSEIDFIVERLKIDRRGPPGLRGERGRDGPPGARGERGERGETGAPAPALAAWEVRPERFEIVPRYSNGEAGPPICLLALFQSYDAAVSEIEDRDLTEAAQASREIVEREVAAGWAR